MRRMIAELNQGYTPDLIIMDGILAFTNGGPSSGELAERKVMVAGTDQAEVGLGISRPDQIRLVSDDEEGAAYAEKLEVILAQG